MKLNDTEVLFINQPKYIEFGIGCICGLTFLFFFIVFSLHLKNCFRITREKSLIQPRISENQDSTSMFLSSSRTISSTTYRVIEVEPAERVRESGCFQRQSSEIAKGISLRKK